MRKTTEDDNAVRVLFRADKSGDFKGVVTAVFDDRAEYPNLTVYEHHGQHGTGSVEWLRSTRAATPAEYAPLLTELGQRGYAVTVGKRLTNYYRED